MCKNYMRLARKRTRVRTNDGPWVRVETHTSSSWGASGSRPHRRPPVSRLSCPGRDSRASPLLSHARPDASGPLNSHHFSSGNFINWALRTIVSDSPEALMRTCANEMTRLAATRRAGSPVVLACLKAESWASFPKWRLMASDRSSGRFISRCLLPCARAGRDPARDTRAPHACY